MKKTEECHYCGADYIPKRRGIQKFCSHSCRTQGWRVKNSTKQTKKESLDDADTPVKKNKIDEMSFAGIGNATVGSAIVELGKYVLNQGGNKPATKQDIVDLMNLFGTRYRNIVNGKQGLNGELPYFDLQTNRIVYLENSIFNNPLV